jgi:alginate O-acetyltransferase complex protein AlgI
MRLNFIMSMFGVRGNALINSQAIVELKAYAILFIVGIISATPWPKKVSLYFRNNHCNIYRLAVNAYYCILMFFSTVYMVLQPIIHLFYFRF